MPRPAPDPGSESAVAIPAERPGGQPPEYVVAHTPTPGRSLEWLRAHGRLLALGAVVVVTALVPLAGAFAGPVGAPFAGPEADAGRNRSDVSSVSVPPRPASPAPQAAPTPVPHAPVDVADAPVRRTRCGPELEAPEGVEAQTCVLTEGGATWARAYYRNATGEPLSAVLSLLAPGGRTVTMHCALSAEDDPEVCDTPRVPGPEAGAEAVAEAVGPSGYRAVAEFAEGAGPGAELLLRAAS